MLLARLVVRWPPFYFLNMPLTIWFGTATVTTMPSRKQKDDGSDFYYSCFWVCVCDLLSLHNVTAGDFARHLFGRVKAVVGTLNGFLLDLATNKQTHLSIRYCSIDLRQSIDRRARKNWNTHRLTCPNWMGLLNSIDLFGLFCPNRCWSSVLVLLGAAKHLTFITKNLIRHQLVNEKTPIQTHTCARAHIQSEI